MLRSPTLSKLLESLSLGSALQNLANCLFVCLLPLQYKLDWDITRDHMLDSLWRCMGAGRANISAAFSTLSRD